jgi:hypothetical protein
MLGPGKNFCTGIRKSLPDRRFKRQVATFPACRVGRVRWPGWILCSAHDALMLQINELAGYQYRENLVLASGLLLFGLNS